MENIGSLAVNQSVQETNLWRAIRRHWLPAIAIFTAIFSLVAYKTFRETPKYQSQTIILIAKKTAVPIVRVDENATSDREMETALSTDIEIFRSPTLLAKAVKKLPAIYKNLSVYDIAANLSIRQDQYANVLFVAYTDTKPARAQAILQAVALTYIDYSRDSQRSPVTNAIRFIEKKLPEARAALNQSSIAITNFRQKHRLDDPDMNAALAFKNKEDLQQKIIETKLALEQTQQQYQVLQKQITQAGQNTQTALQDSVLSQDTTYQNLVNQLRSIEVQQALLSSRFQPNHPSLQELTEQREKIHRLLQDHVQKVVGTQKSKLAEQGLVNGAIEQSLVTQMLEAQNKLRTQTKQLNSLRQFEAQSATNFQRLVYLQQEYKELQRQYQLNFKAVNDFLVKLQELRLREAQEVSAWNILEPPNLPYLTVSPNIKKSLLMGGIAGLLGGIGVAFLLEKSDRRLKNLREVKGLVHFPLLGVIPKVGSNPSTFTSLPFSQSGFSLFTEAIRGVALALGFQKSYQNSNSLGQIFAVTSATSGEGKSTITLNLGLALAELGHRVLMVDAHFNRPSLHTIFRLPNATGLSTALTTTHPWREFIHSGMTDPQKSVETPQKTNFWQKTAGITTLFKGTHPIAVKVIEPYQTDPMFRETNGAISQRSASWCAKTQSSQWQHLDIMTSGPELESAVAWLSSSKMLQLLEQWHQAYDYVLIDTSPITERADTHSLIPKVDEVILVLGMECLTRPTLTQAIEILQRIPIKDIKVLVNFLSREDDE